MKNAKDFLFSTCLIISSLLTTAVCVLLVYGIIETQKNYQHRVTLSREESSPLPVETIEDLCSKLIISDASICDHQEDVYAPDFYDSIQQTLNQGLNFVQVEELLGAYRITECNTGISENFYDGSCMYDLRGDHVFHFTIIFDENRNVTNSFFSEISWLFDD